MAVKAFTQADVNERPSDSEVDTEEYTTSGDEDLYATENEIPEASSQLEYSQKSGVKSSSKRINSPDRKRLTKVTARKKGDNKENVKVQSPSKGGASIIHKTRKMDRMNAVIQRCALGTIPTRSISTSAASMFCHVFDAGMKSYETSKVPFIYDSVGGRIAALTALKLSDLKPSTKNKKEKSRKPDHTFESVAAIFQAFIAQIIESVRLGPGNTSRIAVYKPLLYEINRKAKVEYGKRETLEDYFDALTSKLLKVDDSDVVQLLLKQARDQLFGVGSNNLEAEKTVKIKSRKMSIQRSWDDAGTNNSEDEELDDLETEINELTHVCRSLDNKLNCLLKVLRVNLVVIKSYLNSSISHLSVK
eukprot:CAMPEP_0184062606 /NCGR_PEP_ID=MMETSP0956-20121227/12236_1 /TAXON_ID=627963 /ORGANISM="Aplanochytrium sp, Strain PBS07" /LENGTH=360 /DNA_ID=CAMNT_0026359381 /DNA_START=33 /DNA_END=1115 /DNA_ORIENTATION=-